MGGSQSSLAEARLAQARLVTTAQLEALGPALQRDYRVTVFPVIPDDIAMRTRLPIILFEVGPEGFRLLRPDTDDGLCMYPWGQVHSWAHTKSRFTFRYFDDGKRSIQDCVLHIHDVDPILQHVQLIIDDIIGERQAAALSDADFASLLSAVQQQAVNGDNHRGVGAVDRIRAAVSTSYLMADQGRQLVELLNTGFDKVEVAVILHGRLIDQSHFSTILEKLDGQEDRDNVWHRVTAIKKENSSLAMRKQASEKLSGSLSAQSSRALSQREL